VRGGVGARARSLEDVSMDAASSVSSRVLGGLAEFSRLTGLPLGVEGKLVGEVVGLGVCGADEVPPR